MFKTSNPKLLFNTYFEIKKYFDISKEGGFWARLPQKCVLNQNFRFSVRSDVFLMNHIAKKLRKTLLY
jgi:hypothetical protein